MTTGEAYKVYLDIEAFYSDDERRRFSGEADYGCHWRMGEIRESWRVSYVRETGKVYAVRLGGGFAGPVTVLGVVLADPVPDKLYGPLYYQTLENLLEGWTGRMHEHDGLEWVQQRIREYHEMEGDG